jgi:putative transposase
MTRSPRIVLPSWVHHVTQRGNHQQTVFFSAHDRIVYLNLLARYFQFYEIILLGLCLMDNHVHLVVIPEKESSLSDGIGQLHNDFARWQNIQCNKTGHLWQNRFFSCPVEEDRVWKVLSYVELNPVRAHMVGNAWDWEWSSARAHVMGNDPSGLLDMGCWQKTFNEAGWKKYLEEMAAKDSVCAQIRRATASGRFLGSEATARQLERELGRALLPRKRGRKRNLARVPFQLGKK